MSARALIGVDIGTQGTKAAVFGSSGRCLAQAFEASALHRPGPGIVEEDPERQYASVCRTIRRCVSEAGLDGGDVAGIGIDGQMAGIIGVGRDGRNLTPYDSWLDTRCAEQIAEMEQKAGDEVLSKTGCAPSFNHGPKVLWWKQNRSAIFKRIAAFVQPGGYAAMRMCGLGAAEAFIDKTYLHFSGFADNRAARWDGGLCRRFGVDQAKLPRIVDPQTVVGGLTGESARKCGLRPGVPVIAGCGDTAASFLACGAVREGVGVDVAGTASVFAATTAEFRADRKYRMIGCGHSAVPGLWHPYAYINGGGMNLEWFRRELVNRGKTSGKECIGFDQLNELAAKIEPEDHLPLFVPHLGGRVCPAQPNLRGAWIGLCWDHTAAHLWRAVLEGVALEYAAYQRVLSGLYAGSRPARDSETGARPSPPPSPRVRGEGAATTQRAVLSQLRITGGGEKSELWNQIKSDALQTPVVRIARSEGAPRGVAMLAGWGVGLLKDLPTAAKIWVELGATTQPQKKAAGFYRRRLGCYESLLRMLDGAMSPNAKGRC